MKRFFLQNVFAVSHFILISSLLSQGYEHMNGCLNSEREALIAFRKALMDPYNLLSSWDEVSRTDCCKWRGVSCDSTTGYVVKLDLHGNLIKIPMRDPGSDPASTLSGQIDPALLKLKHIEFLDLSYNAFNGVQIPSFLGSMVTLRHLNLTEAGFAGRIPPQLGNLSNLISLKLLSSLFHGYLTTESLWWLTNITTLEYLDMSSVNLAPTSHDFFHIMNQFPSLVELHLAGCGLAYIPSTLFIVNFTSLRVLDLSNNYFNSSIPSWISNFSSLVSLNLSGNNFHGLIPVQFSKLPNLEELSLGSGTDDLNPHWLEFLEGSWSKLKKLELYVSVRQGGIPRSIGNITSLQYFRSMFIPLANGTIPITMSNLINLKVLELIRYKTFDIIPDWLGQLKNLSFLRLFACELIGPISSFLGGLSSLQVLDLSGNLLTGSIPASLGQITNLNYLCLSWNSLTGNVSESLFDNLEHLDGLSLGYNSLAFVPQPDWVPPFQLSDISLQSCYLGPLFPAWLQTQKHMRYLDISNSSITDVMPTWFWHSTQQAVYLDLSSNKIFGPFSENFASTMHSLQFFSISGNQISGKIPSSIGEMVQLNVLDLSRNKFSGAIPSTLGNCLHLMALDLRNNNLSGLIPDSLGSLSRLRSMHLNDNRLSGTLPWSLSKCINLRTLDLGENNFSGNIPTWIGDSFPALRILRLRSNAFTGSLPIQLSNLKSLQILDAANNSLSGPIPQSFENLVGFKEERSGNYILAYWGSNGYYVEKLEISMKGLTLEYEETLSLVTSMDLSSNNLSGEIPEGLTGLLGLLFLNLSGNRLTGEIPHDIGRLALLESLDLSKNQLSGKIPETISNLTFLGRLNLSYNKLWGEIPSGPQLQALPDPSIYIGNDALCGFPLSKNCTGDEAPPHDAVHNSYDNEDNQGDDEMFGFFVALGLGFSAGFWVFCSILLLKKSWRIAFYRFVDGMKDRIYVAAITLRIRFKRHAGHE